MNKYAQSLILTCTLAGVVGCQTPTTNHQEHYFAQANPSNDSRITTAILEAMLNNDTLSTTNVHVETTHSVVLLSGYVTRIKQSDTAEALAKQTPGVASVRNDIIVRR